MKVSTTQIMKALEKLFNAGYTDNKTIQGMKIEELRKIKGTTMQEKYIIICFVEAIKNKKIVKFLTGEIDDDNEEVEK